MYKILRYISSESIFGMIPVDLLLHCLLGAGITIYSLIKGYDRKTIFIFLVLIAALKEMNDFFFHQYAGWQEYFTDFLITFLYFFLTFLVKVTKNKLERNSRPEKMTIER